MIICIWAQDFKNGIGINNSLPWNIKEEMEHFKNVTKKSIVIMGRKTFESIKKPLLNRLNIVISRQLDILDKELYKFDNSYSYISQKKPTMFFNSSSKIEKVIGEWEKEKYTFLLSSSFENIITFCKKNPKIDMFVIGGKEIYELFLPYSDGIILSKITKDYSCDTFMKPFDEEKYDIGFEKEYTDFKVIFYFVKTLNHEKFSQYESFLERIING